YATNQCVRHSCRVGRALLWWRLVWLLARLWWPAICGYPHDLRALFCRALTVRRAGRARVSGIALRSRWRLPAGHGGHSWIPDLRLRDKYFCVRACRRHHGFGDDSSGVGGLGGEAAAWSLAGLHYDRGCVGGGEIFALALALALSGRAPGLCAHGAPLRQHCDRDVPVGAAIGRGWLHHRVGATLGTLYCGKLSGVRGHRHSARYGPALHPVCPALGRLEDASLFYSGHPVLHGVARRIPVSRSAAKYACPIDQERSRGLVDGVGFVRFLAYHQHGLPELALRAPGVDRRAVLWMDLAQDRVDLRFCDRARPCRCVM